jgi:two-component system cell cycle response regulator DivK
MQKSVLVIEDDEDTRNIYTTALTTHGYEVLTAKQGAEGVHFARTKRPGLIVLDIRMPIMSGWTAMQYLRSYDETRGIPVLGISAYAPKEEQVERMGSLGFDSFLLKPIEPADVVRAIETLIGPPDDAAGPVESMVAD